MWWYLTDFKPKTDPMEGCHERPAEIQEKLHLSCEILFFSIRMHSFEMTSEQFDLKLPHSTHKPIQLSNEWRQVGYMKSSVFTNYTAIGIFSYINMELWSTFDTQLVLGQILCILLSHPHRGLQHSAPGLLQWEGRWVHPFSTISIGQLPSSFPFLRTIKAEFT